MTPRLLIVLAVLGILVVGCHARICLDVELTPIDRQPVAAAPLER